MRPLSSEFIRKLRLEEAISQEASATRNQLPPEPGWDRLSAEPRKVADWIEGLLRAGFHPSRQEVVAARKAHGIRPIPYWGPAERIIYRTITAMALPKLFTLDRSGEAYLQFIKAPVRHSEELQQEHRKRVARSKKKKFVPAPFAFFSSDIKYVVKSDIAAFYQYVDHGILVRELRVRGGDFDAIDLLADLLGEAQGRAYGLPQLLESSDLLSEIYIDQLERTLLREGLTVWRFNDDFRIACLDYSETLHAIEKLDGAARALGLTLSDFKTVSYGFTKYMIESLDLVLRPGESSVDLDEVEETVGEYSEDFTDDLDGAVSLIKNAQIKKSKTGGLVLEGINPTDLRKLRRAFNSLSAAARGDVISECPNIINYVPSLTPTICKYLTQGQHAEYPAWQAVDSILDGKTYNDWQRLWLLHVLQNLKLLNDDADGDPQKRKAWARAARLESRSEVVRIAATSALAACGDISFADTVEALEAAPMALALYALGALQSAFELTSDIQSAKQFSAVRLHSKLNELVLDNEHS